MQQKSYQARNAVKCVQYATEYYVSNQEKLLAQKKNYYKENKQKIQDKQKIYVARNKIVISEYQRKYRKDNEEIIRVKKRNYIKERKGRDPKFKLKLNVSKLMRYYLLKNGLSKNGKSVIEYLHYSFETLKCHIESQFEPWMNWSNWGRYNLKIWDDNNSSTWTWQIDHIIPASCFIYSSTTDEAFKRCWDLSNLRPLSAKQNNMDGVSRRRHV